MNDKKDTSIPPGNRPFWPRGKPLTRQQIWAIKASPLKPADIALEYGITYWRAWSYQSGRRGKGVASPVKVLRYRFARSKTRF